MRPLSISIQGACVATYMALIFTACTPPPKPASYLGPNINDWKSQFTTDDEEAWYVDTDKLMHVGSESVDKLSLSLNSIPEHSNTSKYFSAEVQINGEFPESSGAAFCGFQLSGMEGDEERGIVFGVNGTGHLVAFDLHMDLLHINVRSLENCILQSDSVRLFFAIYSNPDGCVVESYLKNCTQEFYSQTAHLQLGRDMEFKGVSLVAHDPDASFPIWFKNLNVWRGWVPFD